MVLRLGKQGAAPATPAPVVAAAASHQGNGATRPQPKGWGAPAAVEREVEQAQRATFGQRANANPPGINDDPMAGVRSTAILEQRAAVTAKLTQREQPIEAGTVHEVQEVAPATVRAAAQFSPQVRQMLEDPKGQADEVTKDIDDSPSEKPTRTRTRKAAADTQPAGNNTAPWVDPEVQARHEAKWNRSQALQMAINYGQHVDRDADTIEVAKLFLDFLNGVE